MLVVLFSTVIRSGPAALAPIPQIYVVNDGHSPLVGERDLDFSCSFPSLGVRSKPLSLQRMVQRFGPR